MLKRKILLMLIITVLTIAGTFLFSGTLQRHHSKTSSTGKKTCNLKPAVKETDIFSEPVAEKPSESTPLLLVFTGSNRLLQVFRLGINSKKITKTDYKEYKLPGLLCKSFLQLNNESNLIFIIEKQSRKSDKLTVAAECQTKPNSNDFYQSTFYRWPVNSKFKADFYPTEGEDWFIVDRTINEFHGIVCVYCFFYKGTDFYGNIAGNSFEDVFLNPSLSPRKDMISAILSGKKSVDIYTVSNKRSLYRDDIIWKNFFDDLKNRKNNKIKLILWENLSEHSRKKILPTKKDQIPDEITKNQILNNLNKILPDIGFYDNYEYYRYLNRVKKSDSGNSFFKAYDFFIDMDVEQDPPYNFPVNLPHTLTFNRIVLEWAFPDSIKKSSIPRKIVSSYPIYYQEKGKGIRIPHKVWSPDGSSILFTGALEKAYCANVYAVDVKTKKITKILDVNDSSGSFSPDLEWTKNGMVITSGSGIFLRDVKLTGCSPGVIHKLQLPDSISDMRYGKISPDGKQLFFCGKKEDQLFFFVYNFENKTLIEMKAGEDGNAENYAGIWITPGKGSIIKSERDYQIHRGNEDLR